jgi:hypothetical protein
MPLIHACIAPHAGDLIDDNNKVNLTHQTMTALGERLQASRQMSSLSSTPMAFGYKRR